MKVMDGWLVCRRIMPSAERLSSKFHSFPPSFASRPAVHFSDNLSALGIILNTPASRKGVYLFKTLRIISQSERTKIVPGHFMDFFVFLCAELSITISFLRKTYSFLFHARFLDLINSVV